MMRKFGLYGVAALFLATVLAACMSAPDQPEITVDPETGIATVKVPEWQPSVSDTVRAVAEEGMTALETIALSGGSLAGVLAAALGVKKGIKARKAGQEKKKAAMRDEIVKINKELRSHKKKA